MVHTAAFEQGRFSIEQETLLSAEFKTANTKRGGLCVRGLAIYHDTGFYLVEMGGVRRPKLRAIDLDLAFKFEAVAPKRPHQLSAGINDAWFELETSGQGMTIVVFPTLRAVFLAWFTFGLEQPAQDQSAGIGSPGQRWLTAFGYFGGTRAVLDVTLTSGGRFDNPVPAVSWSSGMGRIILDWTDCESATMSYELEVPPLRGTIDLTRVADDNVELCQVLGTQGPPVASSVEGATNGR